jgi:predicted signal transduction protein with EAL and GGDEF domain
MGNAQATTRDLAKHEVRKKRFLLAAGAYGMCVPLLLIAHLLGFITLTVLWELLGVIVAVNAAFFAVFQSGLNERFPDPSLTWAQTLAAIAVLMLAVFHFDQQRGLTLMMGLVVLSFGTFRFSMREFMTAAGVMLAGYAGVINLLMWWKPATVDVWVEAFQWITLALVLPCFAFVCGRLSELRQRVRRTNDELTNALAMIQKMATHDTLTGLPNRALFNETLTHAIAQAKRHGRPLALLFLVMLRL